MSRVSEGDDEQASEATDGQTMRNQRDDMHFNEPSNSMTPWHVAFRRTYDLSKIFDQCSVNALRDRMDSTFHATLA